MQFLSKKRRLKVQSKNFETEGRVFFAVCELCRHFSFVNSYQVRRALGDFGVPIAIVCMVALDFLVEDTFTEKLKVPKGLKVSEKKE